MDQIKIGKFIALCRKNLGLTQMQLAENLGITDRAVSKWETGKSLPDASIMLLLCEILGITVNDLLCGEIISMDNYNKELESNLLEMIEQKQKSDRRLLTAELIIGIVCIIPLLSAIITVNVIHPKEPTATWLILASLLPLLIATPFAIRIEQTAGYYVCAHCGHRHIPLYRSVFVAMHMGTTRYMRCPECRSFSWQKKVLSKDVEKK